MFFSCQKESTDNPRGESVTVDSKEEPITDDPKENPINGKPIEGPITVKPKGNPISEISGASGSLDGFCEAKKLFLVFCLCYMI